MKKDFACTWKHKNLFKEVDYKDSFISLVFNGSGINLMLKEKSKSFSDDIKELGSKKVKFYTCSNSIIKFGIDTSDLFSECETVKAGVLKLIELQSDKGCAYIKP
ncbi:MAG: DsrE family protein [Desulfobacteraceae bacterium]|nr:DsrE family protein [Desulfobacteraceae bacterium]